MMNNYFVLILLLTSVFISCTDQSFNEFQVQNTEDELQVQNSDVASKHTGCDQILELSPVGSTVLPQFLNQNALFRNCMDEFLGDLGGVCEKEEIVPVHTFTEVVLFSNTSSWLNQNPPSTTEALMNGIQVFDLLSFVFDDSFPGVLPNIHELVGELESSCQDLIVTNITFDWSDGSAWPNELDLLMSFEVGCCKYAVCCE